MWIFLKEHAPVHTPVPVCAAPGASHRDGDPGRRQTRATAMARDGNRWVHRGV